MALWNITILLSWGLLFLPALRWLLRTLPNHNLNLLVLIAAFLAVAVKLKRSPQLLHRAPRFSWGPFLTMLIGQLGFLGIERFWDISLLSSLCLFISGYGLTGLYLPKARWLKALPFAALLALSLPFGDRAQAYLGLPARIFAADVVHHTLSALGVANLKTQSIILLENGVASVDAPCSGLRSLWTGSVFLLGATILERRALGLRWALSAAVLYASLLLSNVVRVAMIVGIAIVADQPEAAAVVHEPLGVVGFVLSCGLCYALLRRRTRTPEPAAPNAPLNSSFAAEPTRSSVLPVALIAIALLGFAVHSPRPKPKASSGSFSVVLPQALKAKAIPLNESELDLVQRFGNGHALKRRFDAPGFRGSLLISYSPSWRAHHPPELCLTSGGIKLEEIRPLSLRPGRKARMLKLSNGRTAIYWYQSPEQTTPDMLSRIGSELSGGQRRWVLVSILLDPGSHAPNLFLNTIHRAVAKALEAL